MMLMVSANDIILLYMALELQSLPLYVIAAIRVNPYVHPKLGLKYFLLGLVIGFCFMGLLCFMAFPVIPVMTVLSTLENDISPAVIGIFLISVWHSVTFPYVDA